MCKRVVLVKINEGMKMAQYIWGTVHSQVWMEGMHGESPGEGGKVSRSSQIMKDLVHTARNVYSIKIGKFYNQ